MLNFGQLATTSASPRSAETVPPNCAAGSESVEFPDDSVGCATPRGGIENIQGKLSLPGRDDPIALALPNREILRRTVHFFVVRIGEDY
jgi:hypothetical protein